MHANRLPLWRGEPRRQRAAVERSGVHRLDALVLQPGHQALGQGQVGVGGGRDQGAQPLVARLVAHDGGAAQPPIRALTHRVEQQALGVKGQQAPVLSGVRLARDGHQVKLGQRLGHADVGCVKVERLRGVRERQVGGGGHSQGAVRGVAPAVLHQLGRHAPHRDAAHARGGVGQGVDAAHCEAQQVRAHGGGGRKLDVAGAAGWRHEAGEVGWHGRTADGGRVGQRSAAARHLSGHCPGGLGRPVVHAGHQGARQARLGQQVGAQQHLLLRVDGQEGGHVVLGQAGLRAAVGGEVVGRGAPQARRACYAACTQGCLVLQLDAHRAACWRWAVHDEAQRADLTVHDLGHRTDSDAAAICSRDCDVCKVGVGLWRAAVGPHVGHVQPLAGPQHDAASVLENAQVYLGVCSDC
mmetsp:Transcript_12817/g.31438  ORF Transcript_12817/g.31438 Transcript_12817/m.31438 type:complete len:411 (-) Transcript_12817:818-2050(-)